MKKMISIIISILAMGIVSAGCSSKNDDAMTYAKCNKLKADIGTNYVSISKMVPKGAEYTEASESVVIKSYDWFKHCTGYYDPAKIAEMKHSTYEFENSLYVVS